MPFRHLTALAFIAGVVVLSAVGQEKGRVFDPIDTNAARFDR
jgi:hypothetical protein